MAHARVRVQVEIFDNTGESVSLVGASQREDLSDNETFWAAGFDRCSKRIVNDIINTLSLKHGDSWGHR